MAASNDNVAIGRLKSPQHPGQERLIMLHVSINDGYNLAICAHRAFDNGRS